MESLVWKNPDMCACRVYSICVYRVYIYVYAWSYVMIHTCLYLRWYIYTWNLEIDNQNNLSSVIFSTPPLLGCSLCGQWRNHPKVICSSQPFWAFAMVFSMRRVWSWKPKNHEEKPWVFYTPGGRQSQTFRKNAGGLRSFWRMIGNGVRTHFFVESSTIK